MTDFTLKPIGVIHTGVAAPTPHAGPPLTLDELRALAAERAAAPRLGRVEVFEEFAAGLTDIEDHERLYLLFWLHESGPSDNLTPFLGPQRGVFATRSPSRPNPIGLTEVRLVERRGNVLIVDGVDMYDGTPLIDIKPVLGFAAAKEPPDRC
jgi:tRNA-Thr(GGU) m(6)t(6)A37 methyltransferase TsaA